MLSKFSDSLSAQEIQYINWFVILFVVLVILIILLPALIKSVQRWRLHHKIHSLGSDSIHYVNLPDGLGGYLLYEHLVLTDDGVTIYNLARYRGNVFAADKIDLWTQVEDNRSYKFPNPLIELESKKVALKAQLPDVPVFCGLLVARNVRFPKGKPETVYQLNSLAACSRKTSNPLYLDAWSRIKEMAQPLSDNEKNIYLDKEETRSYTGRFVLSGLVLLLALAWLLIQV